MGTIKVVLCRIARLPSHNDQTQFHPTFLSVRWNLWSQHSLLMEPYSACFLWDGTLQCLLSVRWNLTVRAFCEMEPYIACFLWDGTLQCVISVRWNLWSQHSLLQTERTRWQCVRSVRWNLTVHAFCGVEPYSACLLGDGTLQCALWDGMFEANTPCYRQKAQDYSACFLWEGTLHCLLSVRWNLTLPAFCEMEPYSACFLWDGTFEANTPCYRQKAQDYSACSPSSAWPPAAPGYDWGTCWHHPGISPPHERSSWACLPPPAPSAPGIPARDSICLRETLFYDTARFLHGILSGFGKHLLKHCY